MPGRFWRPCFKIKLIKMPKAIFKPRVVIDHSLLAGLSASFAPLERIRKPKPFKVKPL